MIDSRFVQFGPVVVEKNGFYFGLKRACEMTMKEQYLIGISMYPFGSPTIHEALSAPFPMVLYTLTIRSAVQTIFMFFKVLRRIYLF
jgi:hypothetical protein